MEKSNRKAKSKVTPPPDEFSRFEDLAGFWETHDLTDYGDQLQEVQYEVSPKPARQFVVTLSDDLTKAMQQAVREGGVSMQTLINLWVQERLLRYGSAA